MSAAAGIAACKAVLKMDTSPARMRWVQGITEAPHVCAQRRRQWLSEAGCSTHHSARSWDELPQVVRDKLGAV